MTILKIFVVAFVGVVILSLIKSNNMSFASLLQLCIVGLIFISVIPQIKEMFSLLEQFQIKYIKISGNRCERKKQLFRIIENFNSSKK